MPLVEALPYYDNPRQDAPVRLDLDGVIVPSDVDLTLIGTIHDGSRSSADYASGLFEENYLLFLEGYGWAPASQKRFQRISRGYSNALEEERAIQKAEIENGSLFRKNNALWSLSVTEALYESGVRVVIGDVSLEDATSGRLADLAIYTGATELVAEKAIRGLPVAEEDLVVFAERDAAIARAICESIPKLRREDPKLNPDETLRAVGLYGTVHVQAVTDALTALAIEQDTESFTLSTRHEVDVPAISATELEMGQVDAVQAARMVRFYSDWLRTEPAESDHLWYPDSSA
jgi:hypothetical protein